MDMVFGKESMETHISGNGRILKQMAMVCISGRMEIDMKGNGKVVLSMAKEVICSSMVMFM